MPGDVTKNVDHAAPSHDQSDVIYLIPRDHYPDEACEEYNGMGWEVTLGKRRGQWVLCKFVNARDYDGRLYQSVYRKYEDLIQVPVVACTPLPDGGRPDDLAWALAASGGEQLSPS